MIDFQIASNVICAVLGGVIGGALGYSFSPKDVLAVVKNKEQDIKLKKEEIQVLQNQLEAVKQEITSFQNPVVVSEVKTTL